MSTPPNTLIKQDSNDTPPGPSKLTSARGALHHKSSKGSIQSHQTSLSNFSTHKSSKGSIQSYQTSLSNFSTHNAPSGIYKDREDLSGQDRRPHTSRHHASNSFRARNFSVSEFNYSDTLQKSTISLQNESQSGIEPARRSPDVHEIHLVQSALEIGVKPPSRSYSHSIGVGTNDNVDESLAHRHPGIRCYHCQQDIVGVRFRCVDCTTIDVDICWNCDIAGFPGDLEASNGRHNSSHAMLKIPMPLNIQEIQRVSERAGDLRHAGDHADSHINSHTVSPPPLARLNPNSPGNMVEEAKTVRDTILDSQPSESSRELALSNYEKSLNNIRTLAQDEFTRQLRIEMSDVVNSNSPDVTRQQQWILDNIRKTDEDHTTSAPSGAPHSPPHHDSEPGFDESPEDGYGSAGLVDEGGESGESRLTSESDEDEEEGEGWSEENAAPRQSRPPSRPNVPLTQPFRSKSPVSRRNAPSRQRSNLHPTEDNDDEDTYDSHGHSVQRHPYSPGGAPRRHSSGSQPSLWRPVPRAPEPPSISRTFSHASGQIYNMGTVQFPRRGSVNSTGSTSSGAGLHRNGSLNSEQYRGSSVAPHSGAERPPTQNRDPIASNIAPRERQTSASASPHERPSPPTYPTVSPRAIPGTRTPPLDDTVLFPTSASPGSRAMYSLQRSPEDMRLGIAIPRGPTTPEDGPRETSWSSVTRRSFGDFNLHRRHNRKGDRLPLVDGDLSDASDDVVGQLDDRQSIRRIRSVHSMRSIRSVRSMRSTPSVRSMRSTSSVRSMRSIDLEQRALWLEAEAKRKEEEATRKEEEARKKEDEAHRLEEKARQSLEDAKRLEASARQAEASAKMREAAVQNKEAEAKRKEAEVKKREAESQKREAEAQRKEEQARQMEREARRKEEQARRKEEEVQRKEDEARKREEDVRRKEDDARRREDDARRREEDARQREMVARQKEEDVRRFEEDARRKEVEAGRRREEVRRIEEDYERKKWEMERKEAELKKREAELFRKEQAARLQADGPTVEAQEAAKADAPPSITMLGPD